MIMTIADECGAEGTEDENQVTKGLMALVLAICLLYGDHNADKKFVLKADFLYFAVTATVTKIDFWGKN